ncbi:MAG TPA: aspartate aminotransferase family protein [Candidatus Jacksonbacteria bacterium]|nr:MAG: Aminotransferase [Parcubacteria group bacterium GW2011_GWC2_44_22]OGY76454.1 MAG: hypothetical protein A2295_02270 [Candidatus Jacksonbacteria bacterium RIFOXYB2_FULL_44_15]OGY76825.1 MAG: hypothetical protein A2240_04605 [Candidatus Jacksonbacteria bacterium RIFOXYA2_FULL_43_12]OGY82184.1 MAG: hypothetical protein A2550_05775 [Candidatus Jacksonbacteria bacterium RIFOXYD2_FULL_43_21]HBH45833.1 aspartate aminotransferase family protein [Candidatus Jacksonbacteria bacterium]
MRTYTQSKQLLKSAKTLFPNATQTLSKGYKMFVEKDFPLFVSRAKGCYFWDVDGNKYIDYNCALGPIIIGYNVHEINQKIILQLKNGIIFSLPHKIEVELAKKIISIVPGAEMIRFVKNGADATSGAVRIARAYTGKDIILRGGYHGAQDWYLASQPPQDLGVPCIMKKLIDTFKYNDIESLEAMIKKYRNKIAAVILEPVPMESPQNGYLQKVREITKKNDIVLIFDEIITGFRMSLGGAQEYYKVTPDITCLGKAMANGMPISCIAGKRKIMKKTEAVFISTTFGGETLSMAAAVATIDYLKKHHVIKHTWQIGKMLYDGINNLIKKYNIQAHLIGQEFKFKIIFNNPDNSESNTKKLFFLQQAAQKRIFFGTAITFNYSHKEKEIRYTLKVIEQIFAKIKNCHDDEKQIKKLIRGKIPINTFQRDQR